VELIQEERKETKREEEKGRSGLIMFTDGSQMESGAARYAVAWKDGQSWKGIKAHIGYNQEAYDVECVVLARALESTSRGNIIQNRITNFTNVHATIIWIASDEPEPGQKYALEARKNITVLWREILNIVIEIWWCPAHEGVEENEKVDEWAKLAAEEPDTRGVEGLEWFHYWDRPEERLMLLPRSLANIKLEITKKKWVEARKWAG